MNWLSSRAQRCADEAASVLAPVGGSFVLLLVHGSAQAVAVRTTPGAKAASDILREFVATGGRGRVPDAAPPPHRVRWVGEHLPALAKRILSRNPGGDVAFVIWFGDMVGECSSCWGAGTMTMPEMVGAFRAYLGSWTGPN